MKKRPTYILILSLVFGYIILQFIAWEIMFVRKAGEVADLRQKLTEVSVSDPQKITAEVEQLHEKKQHQVIMIVGEGTVFLLLLLFGIYKIKQSLDREQQVIRQQKNFFLSITHELKTPLSAIKLQLQTLLKHKLEGEKKEELMRKALGETERLNGLIENLLLSSRMDAGQFDYRFTETDLSEICEKTLRQYFSEELTAGMLKTDITPGIRFSLDEQAFPSVITNLVSNAFKYSGSDKQVIFLLRKVNEGIMIEIRDNGCGIPDPDKEKIFERFYRSGNEEVRKSKGTGLGLYITRQVVENHGGKITARDNQPQGTVFTVSFHV